jgi:radical SAM enzyme (TIGR01210 family)
LLISTILKLRHEYLEKDTKKLDLKIWDNIVETDQNFIITLVIPTRGCSWSLSESGGCSVCGYINDASKDQPIPAQKILNRLDELLDNINDNQKLIELKLFNSGSFFDEDDVPSDLRIKIIECIKYRKQVSQFSVESRAEFIIKNFKIIEETKKLLDPIILEIGIGLESSNNAILRDCWNKGTSFEIYKQSITKIRSLGIRIKSYILIKPPFLTEAEAIRDAIKTSQDAIAVGTDVISFNPCNVQNGTLTHYLFQQDRYDPPWLWSVLLIIREIRREFPEIKIVCEPTAPGKQRGTHNCGKCDKKVLEFIDQTIKNEIIPKDLSQICSCYLIWKILIKTPLEIFRSRNVSKLRYLNPFKE